VQDSDDGGASDAPQQQAPGNSSAGNG